MGSLVFTVPLALLALAFLPVLWWLLRVTPPPPRTISFPAVRLLADLCARADQPARTPWWILLIRLLVAVLAIAGLAHPVLTGGDGVGGGGKGGTLLLALDDGFAAAGDWGRRMGALDVILDRAERQGQPVQLLTTAPPFVTTGLMIADEARTLAHSLQPKPWASDRAAALTGLVTNGRLGAVWISDGIEDGHAGEFTSALQRFDAFDVVTAGAEGARLLLPPPLAVGDLQVTARRAVAGGEETVWLRALDVAGQVLARERMTFKANARDASARLPLPAELRNRLARLDLEDVASASAVVLMDERWGSRPVGLVSGSPLKADLPLLSDVYYLERALSPTSEVRRGEIRELLRRDLSMLVLADVGRLDREELATVQPWLEAGGVLVRFAGPHLAAEADALLPVRLRAGERGTGGALTWNQPLTLAPFEGATPFAGLAVPADVRVAVQVLAEPGPDLAAKTWARLSDGTPLVTAERQGQGWLVLVHTTANAEWSNLALSGLFESLLTRLASLGHGVTPEDAQPLPPVETLDGFGRAVTPPGTALSIPAAAFAATVPGPQHPPGFYGTAKDRRAFNLSAAIQTLKPIGPLPGGVNVTGFDRLGHEIDLKPWLLAAALALLVLDLAVLLGRGVLLLAVAVLPVEALAGSDDSFALAAALQPRLAFVLTGDAAVDTVSRLGLSALTRVLEERTSAALALPMGVEVERDPLLFFPLLYWPLTDASPQLSDAAGAKVVDYLRHGGMILFDTRDSEAGRESLRALAKSVEIPPLTQVPAEHVLGRSFYLLRDFPGRVAGGAVWVARDPEGNDGVSPVVIGGNDWAGAWAREDGGGRPLHPVSPGGEQQREMAYRFGVNLVMYALTGNYKADQVHLPAIMERLAR